MSGDERAILGEGKFLRLVQEENWEFVERKRCSDIVVLIALTEDQKLLFTEQYRPPVAARVIEFPAGLVGDLPGQEDESLFDGARRELLEETGYQAERFERLVDGPISAGLTSESLSFISAEKLNKVGPGGGDATEDILVYEIALDRVEAWLDERRQAGCLVDPKVYIGLHFAQRLVS